MGRRCIIALALVAVPFWWIDLGHAVEKRYEVAPPEKKMRLGTEIQLLPGVKLPEPLLQKALPCTVAEFHFDGGEEEWTRGWFPHEWHCDTLHPYSPPYAFWSGDPAIMGYQNMWRERLETDPIVVPEDSVLLEFQHWMRCEVGGWDGGNVWMSTDGGEFQVIFPVVDPYDDLLQAWVAHGGTAVWGYGRKATTWSHARFREYPGAGATVVFRFEFASDWAHRTADDTTLHGWVIDDIVVTSGLQTLWEANCETPDSGYTIYSVEPVSAFFKTDYGPPPSPDSSWRALDNIGDSDSEVNCALTSPWIYIPEFACGDSVREVKIEFRLNEYVIGALVGGYLEDYYSVEVVGARRRTGWPAFPEGRDTVHLAGYWYQMFYDYDRKCRYVCPSDTCGCPAEWRLVQKDSICNGYLTLNGAIGDSIRVRIAWWSDSIKQGSSVWCNIYGHQRGSFFDDVLITAGPGVSQDVAPIWTNEATRPVTCGVISDWNHTYTVRATVRNEGFETTQAPVSTTFTVMKVDTAPEPDDTTLFPIGSCQIPAGLEPRTTAQCNVDWIPEAYQMGDLVEELRVETQMVGDENPGNNLLQPLAGRYYVDITPGDSLVLGYDANRPFYAVLSDSGGGYAVRFEPHTYDDRVFLHQAAFLGGYGGHFRLHVFDEGADDSTPGTRLAATQEFESEERDSGWTYVDLSSFSALTNLPHDRDFWIFVEETRSTDTCGMSCDETTINGEHSYRLVKPDSCFNYYSPRDFLIRAFCVGYRDPLCGHCNGDWRITVADAICLVTFIYREGDPPLHNCDVNLDNRISVADAIYLVTYVYRDGPYPCYLWATTPSGQKRAKR